MWDCPHCGCMAIAPSVENCPQCFKPKDVAAEPGQPSEALSGSPVGSKTEGVSPSPSGGNSGAAPSSPKLKVTKSDPDWGKS